MPGREHVQKIILQPVGILILVHHDITVDLLHPFQYFRMLLPQFMGEKQEVIKIQTVGRMQSGLVLAIDFPEMALIFFFSSRCFYSAFHGNSFTG